MQACIFCLEDLKDKIPLNFSKERICPCKIYAHADCWMQYQLHKGYFECPICHFTIVSLTRSVPINVPTEHIISINLLIQISHYLNPCFNNSSRIPLKCSAPYIIATFL